MMTLEKRNSGSGRHPAWIGILLALATGQILQLLSVIFGWKLSGFSALLETWQLVAYNLAGIVGVIGILISVFMQNTHAPLGKYVTALLLEQYGDLILAVTAMVYTVHIIARYEGNIPLLLPFMGLGLICRYFQIKRELKTIQLDLAVAKRMSVASQERDRIGV